MATKVGKYNAKDVIITINGNFQLSGFEDGEFLTISRNADSVGLKRGADGEGVAYRTNDNSGTITFTGLPTSIANDILQSFHDLNELPGKFGSGFFSMTVHDILTGDIITAAEAWVRKVADIGKAREVGMRQWVIETNNLVVAREEAA